MITLLRKIKLFLFEHVTAILFLLGIGCIAPKLLSKLGYFNVDSNYVEIVEYISYLSQMILVSGIFSAITESDHFKNIFMNAVEDIFYGAKHLRDKPQSWLIDVWKRVSTALYKGKYGSSVAQINDDLLKSYFLLNDFLYEDYHIALRIDRCDDNENYIKITEEINSRISYISSNSVYDIKDYCCTDIENDNNCTIELKSLNFNNEEFSNLSTSTELKWIKDSKEKLFQLVLKSSIPFPADTDTCFLHMEMIKKLPLITKNKIMLFNFKRFTNKIHLIIEYPSDVYDIDFTTLGSLKDFENVSNIGLNTITKKYDGLIFPRQGFLIMIDNKEASRE